MRYDQNRFNTVIMMVYFLYTNPEMGTISCYQGSCSDFFSNRKTRASLLKRAYREELVGSQFRDTCISTVKRHFDESNQLSKQQVLRRSAYAVPHYEVNALSVGQEEEQTRTAGSKEISLQLPYSLASMPEQHRQRLLLGLIRQSYLFVDLSDCIDEPSHPSYQRYLKHELLKNDSILDYSFVQEPSFAIRIEESLKTFDPHLIGQLEQYVRFCRKMKHEFSRQNERFLGRLGVRLEGDVVSKYVNKRFVRNSETVQALLDDVQEVVSILLFTLETLYDFEATDDSHLDLSEPMEEGEQTNLNFYNDMNLFSLVTSLLFQKEQFANFIMEKMKETFRHKFKEYQYERSYNTEDFVSDFIAINSTKYYAKPQRSSQLTNLFQVRNRYGSLTIFPKTRRVLMKIFEKSVPIFTLRMIYELNKQMGRELQQLKNSLSQMLKMEFMGVFNRETELLVIRWLFWQERDKIADISARLMFSYCFIHRSYRIDRKGSCLTTFIQQIENIVQWRLEQ